MRIFITGVSGLLGINAACAARHRWEVSGCWLTHPVTLDGVRALQVDIRSADGVRAALAEVRPQIILHTAALTYVDVCETSPGPAYEINVEGTHAVAAASREAGAQLVHISTDQIFDGTEAWLGEDAPPRPLNVYARTKWLAEQVALSACPGALVVRTNFYGWGTQSGKSFSDWILGHLQAGRAAQMFRDVFFTPILVNDLLDILWDLVAGGAHGIYHVVGAERLSKYEFGLRVADAFGYPRDLITPIGIEDLGLRARRPKEMSLRGDRATAAVGRPLPPVDAGLARLRALQHEGWPEMLRRALQDNPLPSRRA